MINFHMLGVRKNIHGAWESPQCTQLQGDGGRIWTEVLCVFLLCEDKERKWGNAREEIVPAPVSQGDQEWGKVTLTFATVNTKV